MIKLKIVSNILYLDLECIDFSITQNKYSNNLKILFDDYNTNKLHKFIELNKFPILFDIIIYNQRIQNNFKECAILFINRIIYSDYLNNTTNEIDINFKYLYSDTDIQKIRLEKLNRIFNEK